MAEAVCQTCGSTIYYGPQETSVLADHFYYEHPDKDVGHFTIINVQVDDRRPSRSGSRTMSQTEIGNVRVKSKGELVGNISCMKECDPCVCQADYEFDCHNHYKTTVESWSSGPNDVKCPQCNNVGPPLIRRQRNKIAKSSLGAMCLLGCWPLCFLPFMLGGSNVLNLYCKNCGAFLASYDRHLGKLNVERDEKMDLPNLCCNG